MYTFIFILNKIENIVNDVFYFFENYNWLCCLSMVLISLYPQQINNVS